MRLGGYASYACTITSRQELLEALSWAGAQSLPYRVIGGGSNIIWGDEGFNGLLISNAIRRFELTNEDALTAFLTVGAGEPWDSVVERSVAAGLSGIEALSLIPGTAGATPIQNVGAYGQEVSQSIATIEAYDDQTKEFMTIPNFDCAFGYRTSRFKTTDRGRFIITALTFQLQRTPPLPPYYPAVEHYLADMHLEPSAASIREAVVSVRSSKLPDPAIVSNCGSFFANPIITRAEFETLRSTFGVFPHWETDDGIKLSAAWLIEQIGYKNLHDQATGMATWHNQPLVIVNEKAKSTSDLLVFKEQIVNRVARKFGVQLEQEPELLP